MKIVNKFPPNIKKIKEVLQTEGAVFCYGDTIYNPFNIPILPPLHKHEEVHAKQQKEYGVEKWWDRYLKDGAFRLSQEIPAYQRQYKEAKKIIKDRNKLSKYALDLATFLSKNYGNIISQSDAYEVIRKEGLFKFRT